MLDWFIAAGVFFLASLFHGLFGFGSAIIATPLLLLKWPPEMVIPEIALQSFVINFLIFRKMHLHLEWKEIRTLILWSVLGAPIGIWILKYFPGIYIRWSVSVLIFLFVISRQFHKEYPMLSHSVVSAFLGVLAGALGAAFNINGPPVILYVMQKHWSPFQKKVTLSSYFLLSGAIVIAAHAISGVSTGETFLTFFTLMPVTVAGTITGMSFFHRIAIHGYEKWLNYLLILLAFLLII
jgi:hypothetical protein